MFDSIPPAPLKDTDTATAARLAEFSSDAALVIDDRQRVAAWNQAAEQLLGYAREEAIGRRCAEVLQAVLPGGEPVCVPTCEIFQCFRDCRPRGLASCRVRRKDGGWVDVSYHSIVLPRPQGPAAGAPVALVLLRERDAQHVGAPQRGVLQIFALGKFGLAANGRGVEVERWKRRQAVTLLKFLVTQLDRPVHRERILDCLWPEVDEDRGWGRLKVTMYYLREQLRAAGASEDAIQTVGNAYLLKRDAVWVDAESFEKSVAEGRALQSKGHGAEALRRYEEAALLYRGAYLEQDSLADWCAEERERLGEIHMDMLTRKAECHAERGEFAEAVLVCRKGLVHDPCRESFHRDLMSYLARLGRRDWAIAQFRHCREVLGREFGVEPMAETQRLYRAILEQEKAEAGVPAAPSVIELKPASSRG